MATAPFDPSGNSMRISERAWRLLNLHVACSLPDDSSSGHHVNANAPRSAWRRQGLALSEDDIRQDALGQARAARTSARSERSGEPCTATRRARMLQDAMAAIRADDILRD
jgi:hypothetical protein